MKDYGLVSIITPNYNCGKFIAETIESVMAQTYKNWELLIQDDCSTDDSLSVAEKYAEKDNRIKVNVNSTNSGAAITRNNALRSAKGKWIAFLDSDDLWLPNKLEEQLKFMVENNYAFSYHEYTEMSEDGCELGVYVSGIKKVSKFAMYACCWPGCLSVMYDAEKIGIIQIGDVKKNNDTAMWLKVVQKAPCYLLKENLASYRRRKVSITPKPLYKRIWAHYPLFRVAEGMNPIHAIFWVIMNVFGNAYKKMFYVKNYETNLFPDLTPQPKEILYVIGNGFDKAHGISSGYSDFKQWVENKGNHKLIRLMDIFFSNEHDLWCDVEIALGEYDEEVILEYCRPDDGIDYDHMMRSVAAVEDSPDWIFKPILDEFVKSFNEWVESIDITGAKQNKNFHPDSKYLTFNYTETLERVYEIPSNHVLHIHGSRIKGDGLYVVGHNNLKPDDLHDTTSGELYFEQDTKNKIISLMNALYKDTGLIIRKNQTFFNTLNNIKAVNVIGHSLNEVDWAYFDEVAQQVCPNTRWVFHYFSPEDAERIKKYITHSGITNYVVV